MADSLTWVCPSCGNSDIQEVQHITRIVPVEQVTKKYGVQLATSFAYDSKVEISHYRCSNCFAHVCHKERKTMVRPMPVLTQDGLVAALS